MNRSLADLRHTIAGARDLLSVVHTMKAFASANLGQYEASVASLREYAKSVERGLGLCLRRFGPSNGEASRNAVSGVVVFGSDQGLVGRFNETVAQEAASSFAKEPTSPLLWTVGDRVDGCLADLGCTALRCFPVPTSVQAIGPLVGLILAETQAPGGPGPVTELVLFSNRPLNGFAYEPVRLVLFPWDQAWTQSLAAQPWPSAGLPELLGPGAETFRSLVREELFIGMFRACAGSLASENSARLASMQRAEKNIDELVSTLQRTVQRLRQTGIDEELFDVIAGT